MEEEGTEYMVGINDEPTNPDPNDPTKWNYFSASCCLIVCSHTTRIGFAIKTHTHTTGELFTNLFYFNLSLL